MFVELIFWIIHTYETPKRHVKMLWKQIMSFQLKKQNVNRINGIENLGLNCLLWYEGNHWYCLNWELMLSNLPSSIFSKGCIRWFGYKRDIEMPSFLNCLMKKESDQWCRESPYKFFEFPIPEGIEPVILKDWCSCGVEKVQNRCLHC